MSEAHGGKNYWMEPYTTDCDAITALYRVRIQDFINLKSELDVMIANNDSCQVASMR